MSDAILTKTDSNSSSSKDFDPLKRESNASSLNSQSTSASAYHHSSQPLSVWTTYSIINPVI